MVTSGDQNNFTHARLSVQPAGCLHCILYRRVSIRCENDLTRAQCGARIRRNLELVCETLLRNPGSAIHARDEDTIDLPLVEQAQRQRNAVKLPSKYNGCGRQVRSICFSYTTVRELTTSEILNATSTITPVRIKETTILRIGSLLP